MTNDGTSITIAINRKPTGSSNQTGKGRMDMDLVTPGIQAVNDGGRFVILRRF